MSAFEMSKGFTKPILNGFISTIPDDIVDAQQQLQERRTLSLILKSKSTFEHHIRVGDMVQVFNNTGMDKSGV